MTRLEGEGGNYVLLLGRCFSSPECSSLLVRDEMLTDTYEGFLA